MADELGLSALNAAGVMEVTDWIQPVVKVFFKACKSVLRLSKEFQTRSYDSMVVHTSIVFLRYMMLSFELRRSEDDRGPCVRRALLAVLRKT